MTGGKRKVRSDSSPCSVFSGFLFSTARVLAKIWRGGGGVVADGGGDGGGDGGRARCQELYMNPSRRTFFPLSKPSFLR